jgi:hypothetical protein
LGGVAENWKTKMQEWSGLVHERSIAVQAICIPLNFLMLSVGILMAGFPTKQTYERRIILLYFAAKTLQYKLLLSVVHVAILFIEFKRILRQNLPTAGLT